ENGQPSFSYFLRDVSPGGVGMIVTPREGMLALEVGELVNFHLPFELNKKFYNQGVIRWSQNGSRGQICGARLEKRVPLKYPIYVTFETGEIRFVMDGQGIQALGNLVERILEDAFHCKKGVGIYFEHLVPYFKRHGGQRDAKDSSPSDLVTCIRAEIARHVSAIDKLRVSRQVPEHVFPTEEELNTLRSSVALELSLSALSERFDMTIVKPYLHSVRLLEHQLYANFNTLVLVHRQ